MKETLLHNIETWLRDVGNNPAAHMPEALAAAAVLVALLAYLAVRRHRARAAEYAESAGAALMEVSTLKVRLEEREARLVETERRSALLERNLMEASEARAGMAAELAASEKARREQMELVEKSEARLREAFGSLSREALGRNNEMFLSLAKTQLGQFNRDAKAELDARRTAVDALVKPIGETLGRMDAALAAAEKSRHADHVGLVAVQSTLAETTGRLVKALHHSSARGRWGELQLRRVVELAGMLEHCDFEEQVTVNDADGRRLRPDLVVRLVGGKTIVVDAKTPMESYLEAQEADTEEREKELRQRHARAVKAHMNDLGAKTYWSQFEDTPEFVVMFFPNEAVFAEALRVDPGLLEFGALNQVIPASPATLIALLKAAAYGWQQERAAFNARKIIGLGRELHERFQVEYRHLAKVGSSLAKAVDSYNSVVGSAERMLFPSLRKFTDLAEKEMFEAPSDIVISPRAIATEEVEETEEQNSE